MRILVIAAAVLALTAASAQAQSRRQPPDPAKADNKPQVDEKAYKAALDRIPVPDEKYDPWGGARATDTKASKKKN